MNALTIAALSEITAAVEQGTEDPDVGVIVLSCAGRAFSAGLDIKALAAADGPDIRTTLHNTARQLQDTMESTPKVIIAMVHGFCLTGALEIALACDLIIASNRASFGLPEPLVGQAALAGGIHRLARQIGLKRAMGMLLTGRRVDAT